VHNLEKQSGRCLVTFNWCSSHTNHFCKVSVDCCRWVDEGIFNGFWKRDARLGGLT